MREGGLDAPMRRALAWQDLEFTDPGKIDAEMRRVFDICHGCRRCFNLCDSFPRLFDLIDNSDTEELDSVVSEGFRMVVDACTLCDMCFMTKCPYVPPHEFNLDFPHLMLRYRAAELKAGRIKKIHRQLTKTDRNGRLAGMVAPLINWACRVDNALTRVLMEWIAGIHRKAVLPRFCSRTFARRAGEGHPEVNVQAPAYSRKAVLFATCFANYNDPTIGLDARAVLARNGVETEVIYPGCCGMPQFESGDIEAVAKSAERTAAALGPWIERGYDVIALVSSCALMMKFEWPLILPGHEGIETLSHATFDIAEYVVDIASKEGLAEGMKPLKGSISVHLSCHAKAQNMGPKAAEMLRLVPNTNIHVMERCSGHGGSWGVLKNHFEIALKHGKPVARQAKKNTGSCVTSECPLAADHILQIMKQTEPEGVETPERAFHPIQLLARSYGLEQE
ncbi:MAG: heterodisulfide reductase-related iron-sulfur binding cluster [Alphaproteobacteria bacterium]|nr:heterodisulfide reductase-related iron-sulfur binding cluster [Alphaproteobacteria bacterium]